MIKTVSYSPHGRLQNQCLSTISGGCVSLEKQFLSSGEIKITKGNIHSFKLFKIQCRRTWSQFLNLIFSHLSVDL